MNIADRLVKIAETYPNNIAIIEGRRRITFAELNADTGRIAEGLRNFGVQPGMRIALFVRYGIDFISLVFALCKANVTLVLIDPGMGLRRMLTCLQEIEPDGFIGDSGVQIVRWLLRKKFPKAKYNITVGRLKKLKTENRTLEVTSVKHPVHDSPFDSAAIIFTSGSTGPAKGVAFTHKIFDTQCSDIQKRLNIQPGEVDLACFPFFGLFDAAMGVTAVIPHFNTSQPAKANPAVFVSLANRYKITQSFASPAIWKNVAEYCRKTKQTIPTLKRAVSAGAPVSDKILRDVLPLIHPEGDIYTPYGATEALPVAVISAKERWTLSKNRINGAAEYPAGVCVGKKFDTITWKIIKITDTPVATLDEAEELPQGHIGELAVSGPQVTREYINRPLANTLSKMLDGEGRIWHRIGDVGYLDAQDRFWFCGRKAHRVEANGKTYFSIPCEMVFNQLPQVYRSALAQKNAGGQTLTPVLFIEPYHFPKTKQEREQLLADLREIGRTNRLTADITDIRLLRQFPVDIRHNIKIDREKLSKLS